MEVAATEAAVMPLIMASSEATATAGSTAAGSTVGSSASLTGLPAIPEGGAEERAAKGLTTPSGARKANEKQSGSRKRGSSSGDDQPMLSDNDLLCYSHPSQVLLESASARELKDPVNNAVQMSPNMRANKAAAVTEAVIAKDIFSNMLDAVGESAQAPAPPAAVPAVAPAAPTALGQTQDLGLAPGLPSQAETVSQRAVHGGESSFTTASNLNNGQSTRLKKKAAEQAAAKAAAEQTAATAAATVAAAPSSTSKGVPESWEEDADEDEELGM